MYHQLLLGFRKYGRAINGNRRSNGEYTSEACIAIVSALVSSKSHKEIAEAVGTEKTQTTCLEHLSLDEYKTLTSLLLEFRILWMNILTQLAMPCVDFNKTETTISLLQAACQVGLDLKAAVERATNEILHSRLLTACRCLWTASRRTGSETPRAKPLCDLHTKNSHSGVGSLMHMALGSYSSPGPPSTAST